MNFVVMSGMIIMVLMVTPVMISLQGADAVTPEQSAEIRHRAAGDRAMWEILAAVFMTLVFGGMIFIVLKMVWTNAM